MQHLVIGGTGFIGGHLVEHLVERGSQVRVLARRAERPLWLPARAELVAGDASDPAVLAQVVDGVQVVYVTAPMPTTPNEAAAMRLVERTLRGLVAASQRAGVRRLVLVSSVDVYGPALPPRPVDESQPTAPATVTARLRLVAETVVRAAALTLDVVVLRPVTVFGPRDERFTLPLLDAYAERQASPLTNGGRARLSLIYVKDLARVLALVAQHQPGSAHPLNVSGCSTTWRAFVATICAELGVPSPSTGWIESLGRLVRRQRPAVDDGLLPASLVSKTRIFSDDRLVNMIAYHPAYDLLGALHETAIWYRRWRRHGPAVFNGHAAPLGIRP